MQAGPGSSISTGSFVGRGVHFFPWRPPGFTGTGQGLAESPDGQFGTMQMVLGEAFQVGGDVGRFDLPGVCQGSALAQLYERVGTGIGIDTSLEHIGYGSDAFTFEHEIKFDGVSTAARFFTITVRPMKGFLAVGAKCHFQKFKGMALPKFTVRILHGFTFGAYQRHSFIGPSERIVNPPGVIDRSSASAHAVVGSCHDLKSGEE